MVNRLFGVQYHKRQVYVKPPHCLGQWGAPRDCDDACNDLTLKGYGRDGP